MLKTNFEECQKKKISKIKFYSTWSTCRQPAKRNSGDAGLCWSWLNHFGRIVKGNSRKTRSRKMAGRDEAKMGVNIVDVDMKLKWWRDKEACAISPARLEGGMSLSACWVRPQAKLLLSRVAIDDSGRVVKAVRKLELLGGYDCSQLWGDLSVKLTSDMPTITLLCSGMCWDHLLIRTD